MLCLLIEALSSFQNLVKISKKSYTLRTDVHTDRKCRKDSCFKTHNTMDNEFRGKVEKEYRKIFGE